MGSPISAFNILGPKSLQLVDIIHGIVLSAMCSRFAKRNKNSVPSGLEKNECQKIETSAAPRNLRGDDYIAESDSEFSDNYGLRPTWSAFPGYLFRDGQFTFHNLKAYKGRLPSSTGSVRGWSTRLVRGPHRQSRIWSGLVYSTWSYSATTSSAGTRPLNKLWAPEAPKQNLGSLCWLDSALPIVRKQLSDQVVIHQLGFAKADSA